MSYIAHYTDAEGRKWQTMLPDDWPPQQAKAGVPVGPPSLRELGLPLEQEVRLHNALYDRGLITRQDIERRPGEVTSAIMWALRITTARVIALYP